MNFVYRLTATLVFVLGLVPGLANAQLETQKRSANGVTVAVSPINIARDARVWEFKVVLDTHSQDLADDLQKDAVLVPDRNKPLAPLAWEGAGPGGHHREGVLKFGAPEPRPQVIEVRIQRAGESEARSFRWELR